MGRKNANAGYLALVHYFLSHSHWRTVFSKTALSNQGLQVAVTPLMTRMSSGVGVTAPSAMTRRSPIRAVVAPAGQAACSQSRQKKIASVCLLQLDAHTLLTSTGKAATAITEQFTSTSVSGMAEQLSATKGSFRRELARCRAAAKASLPVQGSAAGRHLHRAAERNKFR